MASRNNSEEINFQPYIDTIKNGKIPWNIFVKTMEDLSYTDINRLKCLNAVLLMKLSMSYSDMDRLKYLNKILLKELNNFIQGENDLENVLEDSSNLNDETLEPILNERSNDDNIQTLNVEENEMKKQNLISSIVQETTENDQSKQNAKLFLCHICNKKYVLYFHLKQHIRKVHEIRTKGLLFDIENDEQKVDESEQLQLSTNTRKKSTGNICESCGKSFTRPFHLKRHIRTVHEGPKDY